MSDPLAGAANTGKNGLALPHVARFLAMLKKVKPTSNGWEACCPAHDDTHPSLGVALGKDGRILLQCRSRGCSAQHITQALHLTMADLHVTPNPTGKPEIVKQYDYCDQTGKLLFQVVRFNPKKFKQRRPDGKGDWIWNLQGVTRVLYRLPELVKADPAERVFVVEGEKDADRLASLELVATTNPGGAGKWSPEHSKPLAGRHVIILPDNDEPGRKHAKKVCKALHGIAASVRIVELPGLPAKGDVSDWLQMPGNDVNRLLEVVKATAAQASDSSSTRGLEPAANMPILKPSQLDVLLELAACAELFHSPDGTPFATVPPPEDDPDRGPATLPIHSKPFRGWLSRSYYRSTGKPARAQTMQDALAHLAAQAEGDGPILSVHCRVATANGAIWLDLGSPKWDAVEITPAGWKVVARPPVKFRRSPSMQPLPTPVTGGSPEDLHPFVNVRPEHWTLLVAWLLAALRPQGPYPVLCMHGEQGSAKSTTARVLRALVDPNSAALRSEPREARDLMITATNSWVLALDNLSGLPPWLSDALCRLSTGGGFATRELYTDAEEKVFDAQRPVILTGIEDLATRGDLLERALILRLPAIAEEERRTEADFWQAFELARPRILGAFLDVVAAALARLPAVKLPRLPRMADFATWVTAAEPALHWQPGSFLAAYNPNREAADALALEASPLYPPLCVLLESGSWEGTPTDLFSSLTTLAGDAVARSRSWPKAAHILTGRLERLAPNLRRVGIQIDSRRNKHQRRISITRLPPGETASPASLASPPLPFPSNVGESGDAASGYGDALSHERPAAKNPHSDAGDAGDASSASFSATDDHPSSDNPWES